MPMLLNVESTLTERYQTTVPETVRRALGLKKRDKIHYSIRANGDVVLSRVGEADDEDPALGAFLAFLAGDIASHPERLMPWTGDLLAAVQTATNDVGELDLNAPLSPGDE